MKIIKTVLLGLVLILSVKANAQDNTLTFGVKIGANLSSMSGDLPFTKSRFGYNAGVTLDYGFTENWYLLTGLEYTAKGVNFKKIVGIKPTMSASYIQLPIHAGYKLNVSPSTKIVFHAGPYFALGVNGKFKLKDVDIDVLEDILDDISDVNFDDDDIKRLKNSNVNTFGDGNILKRFDLGLGLGVGAEFGKINMGIGYDFGLLNVANNDSDADVTIRNSNAYLSVGYKF